MAENVRVSLRWVVEGDSLKKPWVVPRVMECAGKIFVELRTTDVSLSQFLDRPPRGSVQLLDILRQLRNQAVDVVVLEHLKIADPMGTYATPPRCWRCMLENNSTLPETVNVKLPPFHGTHGALEGCEMTLLFESNRSKAISMELTSENATYLRSASKAIEAGSLQAECFGNCRKRRRRARSDIVMPDGSVVKADNVRQTLYVKWTNVDGIKARHYQKPVLWKRRHIAATRRALRRWRQAHHHVMIDGGSYELECADSENLEESADATSDASDDADCENEACASSCSDRENEAS